MSTASSRLARPIRLVLGGLAATALLPISPAPAARPAVFGNGKGLAMPAAVLAVPAGSITPPATYKLQPERYNPPMLATVKKSGFDFVRMVVTPMPLMTSDPAMRDRAVAVVSNLVDQATAAGLGAVVDLHFWSSDNIKQDDITTSPQSRKALLAGQLAIARMLAAKAPGTVALEAVNEPHCIPGTGPNSWAPIQLGIYSAIRQVAPKLPLVLVSCRARPDTLITFDASPYKGDPNVYWTFHYYDFFGGQEDLKLLNVPFPPKPELANSISAMHNMVPASTALTNPRVVSQLRDYLLKDRGQATIRAKMNGIADWARRYGIPADHIYLGEFAPLFSKRPENVPITPDGIRWISAVRQEAERQGFNWAYWTYPQPGNRNFIYDPATNYFIPQALPAFGLQSR